MQVLTSNVAIVWESMSAKDDCSGGREGWMSIITTQHCSLTSNDNSVQCERI